MKRRLKRALQRTGLYAPARSMVYFINTHRASVRRREKKTQQFYAQFLTPGDLCFDIGANMGHRTRIFERLGSRVVAVEPQATCVDHLRSIFKHSPNVTIVPCGVAAESGVGQLSVCEDSSVISTFSSPWRERGRFSGNYSWNTTEEVSMRTLDSFIMEFGMPRFCKIDVEGFEKEVLRGLTQPIPALSFEFTREFFGDAMFCIERLESLGPYRFNFSLGETMECGLNDWLRSRDVIARLNALEDPLLNGDVYARLME